MKQNILYYCHIYCTLSQLVAGLVLNSRQTELWLQHGDCARQGGEWSTEKRVLYE